MSTSSPSPSRASTATSTPSGSSDSHQYGGMHPHVYIIALSVLGGITLLCLLALIGYWYIKQRTWNHQRRNESFWRNWHLKTYSRVDKDSPPEMSQRGHHDYDDGYDDDLKTGGGVVDADMDTDTDNKGVGSIMDWWYGKRRSALKMVEEGFEIDSTMKNEKLKKKQKQKLGTVHKVKRFKPNGSFEIDSDVRMAVGDVSLTHCHSR